MPDEPKASLAKLVAPTGVLRAGINLANFLLVSGKDSDGQPSGVAPDLAAEVARRLGVSLELVGFKSPQELGDAVDAGAWDIGLIGAEPQRAEKIAFTAPYVDIPVTYLVPPGSSLKSVAEVDAAGVCIASVAGSAFGLWLEKNIKLASVQQAKTMDEAFQLLASGKVQALAGLRQRLLTDAKQLPGAGILEGNFMTVQQAIGTPRSRDPEVSKFLGTTVEELKSSGFVASLISKHGVSGQLLVSSPAGEVEGDAKRRKLDAAGSSGKEKQTVAVLGCGAMGSVYAAFFAAAGNDVWAVDVWKEHVDAMQKGGLRVTGPKGDFTARINARMDTSEVPAADLVIIATKASGVGAAAKAAAGLLKADGVVLTIQNGLGAGDRIAQHIDTKNVLLGIASNFGACMKGPGHAEHKSMNLIAIGEMEGGSTKRLEHVVALWSEAGFTAKACEDITNMIWEKLLCNVFVGGACTLTGLTVGEMVDQPSSKSVALACAREAYAVGQAKGIKFSFEDLEAYLDKFVSTVRGARPSMAQDHAARRRGEVDAINGAIPPEAEKVGLKAPINETLANLIRARESAF
eukprot:TRINITY_DN16883_c0_g1_i3.p1 TRINITY_DN16883_c0_g1~~TRINITY_DN16883_c0_g1_i3.p1  ORF type:complete len:588 (-),score=138.21 TRINITY_DN16883_c0_g1_i3:509-2233(-)